MQLYDIASKITNKVSTGTIAILVKFHPIANKHKELHPQE